MARLLKILVAVCLGVLLGLVWTIGSLDSDNRGVMAGPWHGAPRDGTAEIDPYALAANARASLLPLGASEGLTFVARTDSKGAVFDRRCDYLVKGPMPPARFWTLSLLTPEGFPVADPAGRYGFTSSEVLRFADRSAQIDVSPEARGGNWLPTGDAGPFVLMLRLYDTSLSTAGTIFEPAAMPLIERKGCR